MVPLAEEVVKLTAVCTGCAKPAAFSRRLDATSLEVEDIGGADKYDAVCRACFFAGERAERERFDPDVLASVASSPTDSAKAIQAMRTLSKLALSPRAGPSRWGHPLAATMPPPPPPPPP